MLKDTQNLVDAAKGDKFTDPIRVDVQRFCDRFKDQECYKFSDNAYRFILRTLKKFLPSELDLKIIKAVVALVYTL